jgi:hypothetical protein
MERPLHLGIPGQQGTRNAIVTGVEGMDTDQGPYGNKPTADPQPTSEQIVQHAAMKFRHLMQELKDQGFDYSHPVDEYAPQGMSVNMLQFPTTITVMPDYDMPEKIENVLVIIPSGALSCTLQLGQRTLNLYAGGTGAGLVSPMVITIPQAGIILNSDDPRILTLTAGTGGIFSAPYLGLTGFALTRGQFS